MGVVFARPDDNDRIIAIARNSERNLVDPDAVEDTSLDSAGGTVDAESVPATGSDPAPSVDVRKDEK
jgi:DNA gyrase subunit A